MATITGTPLDDKINLSPLAPGQVVFGLAGNDDIYWGSGDDLIYGGSGNDRIIGSAGQDTIYGEDGNDRIDGGLDDDLLYGNAGHDSIEGGWGSDTIYGGPGNDTLEAGREAARLIGEAGNDYLLGDSGRDFMDGGIGDDTLMQGFAGSATLKGGAGNDLIVGYTSGFNNTYTSGPLIYGGPGFDRIMGGEGNDTVVYGHDRADYALSSSASGLRVSSLTVDAFADDGADRLTDVEVLRFADQDVIVDTLLFDATPDETRVLLYYLPEFERAPLRVALPQAGNSLFDNDLLDGEITEINGAADTLGTWFEGSDGGLFRVFGNGAVDFRNDTWFNRAQTDETGFAYTISDGTQTASAQFTLDPQTGFGTPLLVGDETYRLSGAELESLGAGWTRLGAVKDDTRLLVNENRFAADTGSDHMEIALINNVGLRSGVWFDGSNGGQFRVFEGGVVDFRNQGNTVEWGEETGFSFGVFQDGLLDLGEVRLKISNPDNPLTDDDYSLTPVEASAARDEILRLGSGADGTGLLGNDDEIAAIELINGRAIRSGVWFEGSNGGEFRVFSGGVIDYKGVFSLEAGEETGFTYGITAGGDTFEAEVTLTYDFI